MEKLTKEQIQFIDDRLYNLGVEFMDIRYEMVDHIASELEAKDGDFGEEWTEYFILNRRQLLEQNKKAKKTAIVRAISLYFKTLVTPLALASGMLVFMAIYFYIGYFVKPADYMLVGLYILSAMILPLMWLGRKNKSVSVMRPMVLINTALYSIYQLVMLASYSIDDKALRAIPQHINASVIPALMLILIISLYRCRKQYVGKYI